MKEGFGGMPRSRIALETGMLGLSDRHITESPTSDVGRSEGSVLLRPVHPRNRTNH